MRRSFLILTGLLYVVWHVRIGIQRIFIFILKLRDKIQGIRPFLANLCPLIKVNYSPFQYDRF